MDPTASDSSGGPETAQSLTQRWLELDNTIRRSNEMVREIRSERNVVGDRLISLLQDQGYTKPSIRLGNETIVVTQSSRRPPITHDMITRAMVNSGVHTGLHQAVLDAIDVERAETATVNVLLSRRTPRRATRTRRAAIRRTENQPKQTAP